MKCRYCGVEMLVDRVEEKEDSQSFFFKCPNPACPNYGYRPSEGGNTEEK